MKRSLIIKKYKPERVCFRFAFVFIIVIGAVCAVLTQQYLWLLIFSPMLLFFLTILVYFESWHILFGPNGIRKSVFLMNARSYSYSQIMDVFEAYSFTNHGYITLVFHDGKRIVFRLQDENADKAVKIIMAHHSIRRLPAF